MIAAARMFELYYSFGLHTFVSEGSHTASAVRSPAEATGYVSGHVHLGCGITHAVLLLDRLHAHLKIVVLCQTLLCCTFVIAMSGI